MNDLIAEMNRILQQWQRTYDILHLTRLNFMAGENGTLYLNDIPVHGFRPLPLEYSSFGSEYILYCFAQSRMLYVTISWPEEGIPILSSVSCH